MKTWVTYIRLGRTQLELNETDLGLLDPRWATRRGDNGLIEHDTIDEFGVFNGTANFLHNSNIPEIDIG